MKRTLSMEYLKNMGLYERHSGCKNWFCYQYVGFNFDYGTYTEIFKHVLKETQRNYLISKN